MATDTNVTPKKTLTLSELADEYQDFSYSTYVRWASEGKLPGCRQLQGKGGKYSVLRSVFEESYNSGFIGT